MLKYFFAIVPVGSILEILRRAKVQIFGKLLYRRVLIHAKHCYENCDDDLPSEIEILSPFFGVEYSSMFVDTCLPSILQSGIDKICLKVPTYISIHCPESDWEEIENKVQDCVKQLPVHISWFPIESPVGCSKKMLMSFVRSRVQASLDRDRVTVFAFPDLIFGRGLDRVIANTKHGEYVVCCQIRTLMGDTNLFKSVIKQNLYRNCDLVKYGLIDFPHRLVQLAFEERHDYLHFKKHDDIYLGYFKEPPPLLMRGAETEFEAGFERPFYGENGLLECLDHDIPNLMLRNGMLRAINDSEYFCWLELTSESVYQKMVVNKFNLESALYLKNLGVKFTLAGV